MFSLTLVLFLLNMTTVMNSQSYDSVRELCSKLLSSHYNPDILPLVEQSDVLNINLTTSVFSISEVDQVRGAITMSIMATLEWYDQMLTWNPKDHEGITNFSVKSENVWTPPLTVANPVKFTMLDKSWMQVLIQYNGKTIYTVEDIIEFTCSFNMKFWPFDKHACSLKFFVNGYPYNRLSMSVPGTVVNTDYYTKNGEWFLDENSFEYITDESYGMSEVIYTFKIARLPAFYMLTEIIPINGIGALTCLVFLLPSESGERVSYSITIILSLAVFLTVTAEDLPKNSEPVPVICLYILFLMIVCIFALIMVILNLILYHRKASFPISNFYKLLVQISQCRCHWKMVQEEPLLQIPMTTNLAECQVTINSQGITVTSPTFVSGLSEDNITWKVVSEALDRVLFCAMVLLTYTPSIILLIYIATASDYVTG